MIAALNTKILLLILAVLIGIGGNIALENHRAQVAREKMEAAEQKAAQEEAEHQARIEKYKREAPTWGHAAESLKNWRMGGPAPNKTGAPAPAKATP